MGTPIVIIALIAVLAIGLGASPLMVTPRAGVIAIAITVSAIALPGAIVGLAGIVLAGACLADAVLGRRAPTVERTLPRLLVRGRVSSMAIASTTTGAGSVRVRQPRSAEVGIEPAEADGRLDAHLLAARRGRHQLGPVATRVTGPLRLAAWFRTTGDAKDVVVYPDVPNARRIATAVRRGLFRDSGELTRGPLGLGSDFESIRDYFPDDDIRQVNWPATQRQGRPMSNQYRVEQDRTVIGLVDSGRLMAAPTGDRTRLDAALDALTAIAFVADEVGDRCGVVAFADNLRRTVAPRRRGADAIVRAIFDLEPAATDSAYDRAFHAVGGGKRALVIVFTDLLDGAAASELLHAVPVLSRRHAVVIASVVDPDLDEYRRRTPSQARDVYQAAAALDLSANRRIVVRQLERAGAAVVEARPDEFSEACVRAYLREKRRARL
ncbi:MAG: DUF58 domain-containing protein [Acidimicrobiia bacterium]